MTSTETVVYDQPHPCIYLPDRIARLPHRLPTARLSPEQFDQRLAAGDRRSGPFLYRTACPTCHACEAIRINVAAVELRQSQFRAQRRGDQLLTFDIARPKVDEERVALFNRHRQLRNLDHGEGPIDEDGYTQFLTNTCCETLEIAYRHQGQLVGIAIADGGATSLSAVYCFYEPTFRGVSLGTYSIIKQLQICAVTSRTHLYLGYYIAQSTHMAYKGLFRPHERLINGHWTPFA